MDEIRFVQLCEVDQQQIIDLMNNEMVGKQLPLLAKYPTLQAHEYTFTPSSMHALF